MSRRWWQLALTPWSIAVAATAGGLLMTAAGHAADDRPELAAAAALEQGLIRAISTAEKSVVAIARVRRPAAAEAAKLELRPDPFGRPLAPSSGPGPMDPDFIPTEYASGVVIGREGLILTAQHVLAEASEYYVTLPGGKVHRATVKGADPRSDLAVLAIEAGDLTPIVIAEAEQLRRGQVVLCLGNPYAIARDGQASASWGIVANLGRKPPLLGDSGELSAARTLHQFGTLIQTDVRLNQAVSGGALVNLRGELVGLSVAFGLLPGYESSAGYAIPMDAGFRRVIEILRQGREVEYGLLGVRPANLSPRERADGRAGVRIQGVVAGSPAQRAGLKPNDVIRSLQGRPVSTADELMLEIGRLQASNRARLSLVRGERPLELEVRLAKYPVGGLKVVTLSSPAWRGLAVEYTSAADTDGNSASSRPADDGAFVVAVQEGSPAWRAGIRPGMVISHVQSAAIIDPPHFRELVAGKTGAVRLRFHPQPNHPETALVVGPE